MSSNIKAVRALMRTYALNILIPIGIIVLTIIALIIGVIYWLAASVSAWWWILLLPLFFVISVTTLVFVFVSVVIRVVTEPITKKQKKAAKDVIEKIGEYSELSSMPKFLVAFHILKGVRKVGPKNYIQNLSRNSQKIQKSYQKLVDSFDTPTTRTSSRTMIENEADKA